jgi:glycosyltransferase involved in cell wall biosynthesis
VYLIDLCYLRRIFVKKFSIIIPTLNEATGLSDFLLALQPLRKHCEIIIADAGSTDDTHRITRGLVDQFIVTAKGRAIQMNAGTKQASADIASFKVGIIMLNFFTNILLR